MARIETDPNYTAPTFSRATEENDLFKKTDVQNLAAAVSSHDHTPGKGAQINGSTIGRPLDLPGSVRAGGEDIFVPGLGVEMGYSAAPDYGFVQAVWRQPTVTYKNLLLTGQTVAMRNPSGHTLGLDAAGNLQLSNGAIVGNSSLGLRSIPAGTSSTMIHSGGDTYFRQENQVFFQNHTANVWSKLTAGEFISGANKYGFGSGTANVTTDGVNLLLRGGGIYCQDAAGAQTNLFALSVNATHATIPGTINCGYVAAGGTVVAAGIESRGNLHVNSGGAGGQLYFNQANTVTAFWDGTLFTFSPHVYTPQIFCNHIANSNVGGHWFLSQGNQADRAMLTGALGIGTNDVQGRVLFVNGNAGGTSTWQQVSSLRFKSNVEVLAPATAVQFVTDDTLRPLRYEHELRPDEGYEYGFAAEEFVTRVPESVKLDDEGLPLAMEYSQLIPILWAALRNTIERVDALEAA
jgi:hypothetical protein